MTEAYVIAAVRTAGWPLRGRLFGWYQVDPVVQMLNAAGRPQRH